MWVITYRHKQTVYLRVSTYTSYYKISVQQNFLELIENCVPTKSVRKEAMYNKALLYKVWRNMVYETNLY